MILTKYFVKLGAKLLSETNRLVDLEIISLFPPSIFTKGINNLDKYEGNTLNANTCHKYVTIPITKWFAPREILVDQIKFSSFTVSIPDGKAFGGTLRGWGAVDLQASRVDKNQVAGGRYSFVVGKNNKATGDGSISMGINNTASGDASVSIGTNNISNNDGCFLLGNNNSSTSPLGYVMGESNLILGQSGVAIGHLNQSSHTSYCIGYQNKAKSVYSIAMGSNNDVSGYKSLVVGNDCITSGAGASYILGETNQSTSGCTLIGYNNISTAVNNILVGTNQNASGVTNSTNIGVDNKPITTNSITFGFGTRSYEGVGITNVGGDFIGLFGYTEDAITEQTLRATESPSAENYNSIWLEASTSKLITFSLIGKNLANTDCIAFTGKLFAYADSTGVVNIIGTPTITKEFYSSALSSCTVDIILDTPRIDFNVLGVDNTNIAWFLLATTYQTKRVAF